MVSINGEHNPWREGEEVNMFKKPCLFLAEGFLWQERGMLPSPFRDNKLFVMPDWVGAHIQNAAARGLSRVVPVIRDRNGEEGALFAEYENVANAMMWWMRNRFHINVITVLLLPANHAPDDIYDLARVFEVDLLRSELIVPEGGVDWLGPFRTVEVRVESLGEPLTEPVNFGRRR